MERRPLVLVGGMPSELPAGDTVPGPSLDKTVSMPNGDYTLKLSDRNTVLVNAGGGAVITIPSGGSVNWPPGSTMVLINFSNNPQTVARGDSGVALVKLLGSGVANANVTLASGAYATLLRIDYNIWVITGPGVS